LSANCCKIMTKYSWSNLSLPMRSALLMLNSHKLHQTSLWRVWWNGHHSEAEKIIFYSSCRLLPFDNSAQIVGDLMRVATRIRETKSSTVVMFSIQSWLIIMIMLLHKLHVPAVSSVYEAHVAEEIRDNLI
jgi:hypothetical protein